jgi:hypothetical protein
LSGRKILKKDLSMGERSKKKKLKKRIGRRKLEEREPLDLHLIRKD